MRKSHLNKYLKNIKEGSLWIFLGIASSYDCNKYKNPTVRACPMVHEVSWRLCTWNRMSEERLVEMWSEVGDFVGRPWSCCEVIGFVSEFGDPAIAGF